MFFPDLKIFAVPTRYLAADKLNLASGKVSVARSISEARGIKKKRWSWDHHQSWCAQASWREAVVRTSVMAGLRTRARLQSEFADLKLTRKLLTRYSLVQKFGVGAGCSSMAIFLRGFMR